MKVSDNLMKQEWGPLDFEALFGAPERIQDHHIIAFLEEYHANYAQRENWIKSHEKRFRKAILQIEKKVLEEAFQLLRTGKPIPESLETKMLDQYLSRLRQAPQIPDMPQSNASKHLSRAVEQAIIHNSPKDLHSLANAIKRMHGDGKRIKGRTSGVGATFKIEPHDPVLVAGLKLRAAQKLSSSKVDFQKAVQQATGLQMGDKKAQRTLRKLGVPPSKGGRPRKHHPKNGHG